MNLSGKAAWVSVLSSCELQLHSVLDLEGVVHSTEGYICTPWWCTRAFSPLVTGCAR